MENIGPKNEGPRSWKDYTSEEYQAAKKADSLIAEGKARLVEEKDAEGNIVSIKVFSVETGELIFFVDKEKTELFQYFSELEKN